MGEVTRILMIELVGNDIASDVTEWGKWKRPLCNWGAIQIGGVLDKWGHISK